MTDKNVMRESKLDLPEHNNPEMLTKEISSLIDEARNHVAREYTSTQAVLCWLIGKRINEELLKFERAGYG